MADRGMSGAMLAALTDDPVNVCHLLEFELSPTVYLTDAAFTLEWSGNTYVPSSLLGVDDITESLDYAEQRVSVVLSGVDQAAIALFLQYEYLNRVATIRKAVFDEDRVVVVDPCIVMRGRLDKPVVATDPEAGTCTVSIDIVGRSTPLGQHRGRMTNSASQHLWWPGDDGFEHVNGDDETLIWGKEGARIGSGRGGTANSIPYRRKVGVWHYS